MIELPLFLIIFISISILLLVKKINLTYSFYFFIFSIFIIILNDSFYLFTGYDPTSPQTTLYGKEFLFENTNFTLILNILVLLFYLITILLEKEFFLDDEREKRLTILLFYISPFLSSMMIKTIDIFIYTLLSFILASIFLYLYSRNGIKQEVANIKSSFIVYFIFLLSFIMVVIYFNFFHSTRILEEFPSTFHNHQFVYFLFPQIMLFLFIFPINIFIFDIMMFSDKKLILFFTLLITFPSLLFLLKFFVTAPSISIDFIFYLSLISYIVSSIIILLKDNTNIYKVFLLFTLVNETLFLIVFEFKFKIFYETGFLFYYVVLFFFMIYSFSNLDYANNLKNSFITKPYISMIFFISSFLLTTLPVSFTFFYQYRFLLKLLETSKFLFWSYLVILVIKTFAILRFNLKLLVTDTKNKNNFFSILQTNQYGDLVILIVFIIFIITFYTNVILNRKDYLKDYEDLKISKNEYIILKR